MLDSIPLIVISSFIAAFVIGSIIVAIIRCCQRCDSSSSCKVCHHTRHGNSQCNVIIDCSRCDHYHSGKCDRQVARQDGYETIKVDEPITEEYDSLEDVEHWRDEVREVKEPVPYTRYLQRTERKTRLVPVQRMRLVPYTEYETQTRSVPSQYMGFNGYNAVETIVVPIQRTKNEPYTEQVPEGYDELVSVPETYFVDEVVKKTIRVPYTVRENVKRTRVIGHKTVDKRVPKTVSRPCGCTRIARCSCTHEPSACAEVFGCCYKGRDEYASLV